MRVASFFSFFFFFQSNVAASNAKLAVYDWLFFSPPVKDLVCDKPRQPLPSPQCCCLVSVVVAVNVRAAWCGTLICSSSVVLHPCSLDLKENCFDEAERPFHPLDPIAHSVQALVGRARQRKSLCYLLPPPLLQAECWDGKEDEGCELLWWSVSWVCSAELEGRGRHKLSLEALH